MNRIPIYIPSIGAEEKALVNEALDGGWISSRGKFVTQFEKEFAAYVERKYAIAVCNGTVALHLALESLKSKFKTASNNAVLCPSLTYVSSANAIRYANLTPLFVDVDESGVMTNEDVARGLAKAKELNLNVVAIMAVHLYGNMSSVMCENEFGLPVIEDCAEAFGSELFGKVCGNSNSEIACFSFFGNKTITTGEGGMVVCDDDKLYEEIMLLKSVGQRVNLPQRYNHLVVGYNYRMTNLAAAIGVAQLSRATEVIARKRRVASWYEKHLKYTDLLPISKNTNSSYWMITILLRNSVVRDGLSLYLDHQNVETRPAFLPMHVMVNLKPYAKVDSLPNSEMISECGLNLPSWPGLTEEQVQYICESINEYICKLEQYKN